MSLSHGAINSRQGGNLHFDINRDGIYEMTLSQIGLGIGVLPAANLHVGGNAIVTGSLTIGTGSATGSNLNVNGTMGYIPSTFSSGANTISNSSLILVDTSLGNVQLSLPAASSLLGRIITIKRTSLLNTLFLSGAGNLMDTYSTLEFGSGNFSTLELISNGTSWYIMGQASSETLAEIATSSLTLWWKLDETSGNTAQGSDTSTRSGNATNLSFTGNSLTGALGSAISMGNVFDAIINQDNTSFATTEYSYSFWLNSNHPSTASLDSESYVTGASGFCWNHSSAKYRQAAYHKISDGSYVTSAISSTLSTNVWNHVAIAYSGSSLDIYLNGAHESGNALATSWVGAGNVTLSHPQRVNDGIMRLDDFRVYNTCLTADAIQALYQSGNP